MNRKLQIVVTSLVLIMLLVLLGLLLSRLPFPVPAPTPTLTHITILVPDGTLIFPTAISVGNSPGYVIEKPKIGRCSNTDIEKQVCDLSGQGNQICIAWSEVGRDEGEPLAAYLSEEKNPTNLLFEYHEENPTPDCQMENTCCRVVPVDKPILPSNFPLQLEINIDRKKDVILPISRTYLTLTTATNPKSYQRVGDNITYSYSIKNTGKTSIGPSQFTITDSKLAGPIACGSANTTLTPTETVICYATYVITKADIEARSVTSTARVEGADPVTTTITSVCHPPEGWVAYDVRSTDTLDAISTWYPDLTLEILMQANCLNTATISPGQKLFVPGTPLPAKLVGIVFMDPNHNDRQDRNEQGLPGAPVRITDINGALVATAITGVNGTFQVDLPPGTYFVFQFQVILKPGETRNQRFAVVPVP